MRTNQLLLLTAILIAMLWSCQKAPEFTFVGPDSIELKAEGGSSTITFTANRDWTVGASDPWVSLSPSSGSASDGTISVSVTGSPNMSYDDRSTTVTIRMEGFSQTVTVLQRAAKGLIVPTKSFILGSDAGAVEVEVQSNVEYSVSISEGWIKQVWTRGLVSSKLSFSIEENTSTDTREGRITIKAPDGSVPDQVISVTQAARDAIIVKDSNFDLPYGGGEVEVKVEANVDFDVKSGAEWIHFVQTKAMSTSTVCLSVDENQTYSLREGKVEIVQKGGTLSHTVTIRQAGRVAVAGIELDHTELFLKEGQSATLVATLVPSEAIPQEAISWSSSDTQVATVADGKVTANNAGEATITASADGFKATCSVGVTMDYQAISITDLKPTDIMPVLGQVEWGLKSAYDNMEHTRLAEATRIVDMMWEYGTGVHTPEAYQSLMGRLNTGILYETPLGYPEGYDFLECIGNAPSLKPGYIQTPSDHGHTMWSILLTWVKHAHFVMCPYPFESDEYIDYIETHTNSVFLYSCSVGGAQTFDEYKKYKMEEVNALTHLPNYLLVQAAGNRQTDDGHLITKIYNEEYDGPIDEHGSYNLYCSFANSSKNYNPGSHLLVCIGTNPKGVANLTSEYDRQCSLFPLGFADNVLFAGHPIISKMTDGRTYGWSGDFPTSPGAPQITAMACLCFQMYAGVEDIDQLLEMIRSTSLTETIKLDGQAQSLLLVNPGGVFKKYCMTAELPSSIGLAETVDLTKKWYKGLIFAIPGAEVRIGDEWIAYDAKNKNLILAQNPMTLEWRLNGDLLKKYGYSAGQTIEGQIITVDDKWGGLRLEVPMTVQVR